MVKLWVLICIQPIKSNKRKKSLIGKVCAKRKATVLLSWEADRKIDWKIDIRQVGSVSLSKMQFHKCQAHTTILQYFG